ncbi:dTDP-4-dehydrorhamnose 3,5-epimerase [Myroides injenensis]|uniref:dTDP-4-dehydrorhamnose 3,5-epimerase n=1 Tax=Myroides injenensis TaxID=1183151 RepID=UPI000289A08F|nr:dTDP-4-dehydrorhamnose 3,5-epimerase [Myroides injenensis]
MEIQPTLIKDCFVIKPKIFGDDRGYFFESFNEKQFEELMGMKINFVQDNQSLSKKGVLRGLHFQKGIYQQAKLVRVIKGKIEDVVVDLRKNSPTYGKFFKEVISEENHKQIFIPRGCAHGFLVLSEEAIFNYKCDNYYHPEAEGGIIYNDEKLGIDWSLEGNDIIISEKDKLLPSFNKVNPL